jgi:hypothetical protein
VHELGLLGERKRCGWGLELCIGWDDEASREGDTGICKHYQRPPG